MRQNVQIPGLQPNSTYVVQIRGVNDEGQVGPWSSGFQFQSVIDQVAPGPVTNLSVTPDGSNFVIDWDPPITNEDGSDFDDFRDFIVTIVADGLTRTFNTVSDSFVLTFSLNRSQFVTPRPNINVTVQARDRVGNLGAAVSQPGSNAVPTAPVLTAAAKRNAVELTWTESFDGDGLYYEIWKNGLAYVRVAPDTLTWTDTDVGSGVQAYYVKAVDVFGQSADSNTANEAEVSLDFDDPLGPKPPTSLQTVSALDGPGTVAAEFSWLGPIEDTDNSSYTDQEGFELRYRFDIGRPWTYIRVPDLRTEPLTAVRIETEVQGLPAGETVSWEVRAFDRNNNYSTWATSSAVLAVDDVPPAVPTGLTVSGGIRTIIAKWSPNAEADLAGYRVYASTTPGVTTSDTLVFEGLGTSTSFSAGDGETWYVKVLSYDTSGNTSALSTEQSSTTLTIESDTTPPSNVTGLALSYDLYYHGASQLARIRATWNQATDADSGLYGYVVSWRRVDTVTPDDWTDVVVTSERYVLTGIQLSDIEDAAGEDDTVGLTPSTYEFRVKALDVAGNQSVAWSTTESVVITLDGDTPRGEIEREVPITFSGALQSDNFLAAGRGFRISERSFELYGDADHDVSLVLGRGGQGLNLSTVNDQFWFGSRDFDNATWRVGPRGEQRSGGPGAIAERLFDIAEFVSAGGNAPSVVTYNTVAPVSPSEGDVWSDGDTLYMRVTSAWVDQVDPLLAQAVQLAIDELYSGTGSINVYVSTTEPVSPSEHDIWLNDSLNLHIYRHVTEEVDGSPVTSEFWYDLFNSDDAFYISESGDIWSGASSPMAAPWSISAAGRARFTDASITAGANTNPGESILAVTSDSGDPLVILRKVDIDSWDFRIGTDMFIDAGGHLQLSGGDISLTDGNIVLSGGVFEMSGGALNLTGTPITLQGSDFTVQSGNIIVSGGGAVSSPSGVIMSSDYDYELKQGWALDSGNLYLFSGEVAAEALNIGIEQNLLDYGYTTMAYPTDWYDENVYLPAGGTLSLTSLWSRYGPNSLRMQGGASDSFHLVGQADGSPDFSKIRVEPGGDYIFSAYVHNLAGAARNIQMFFVGSDGSEQDSSQTLVASGETERVSFSFTVPGSGGTGGYVGFRFADAGTDFAVDGLLLEQRSGESPSVFNIGGATTIDGGSIKTGAIESNNYLAGETGWKIGMDGAVEFQGGIFRGQLFASDLVSGTIDNQEFLLSDIESFIEDPTYAEGWAKTEVLERVVQ